MKRVMKGLTANWYGVNSGSDESYESDSTLERGASGEESDDSELDLDFDEDMNMGGVPDPSQAVDSDGDVNMNTDDDGEGLLEGRQWEEGEDTDDDEDRPQGIHRTQEEEEDEMMADLAARAYLNIPSKSHAIDPWGRVNISADGVDTAAEDLAMVLWRPEQRREVRQETPDSLASPRPQTPPDLGLNRLERLGLVTPQKPRPEVPAHRMDRSPGATGSDLDVDQQLLGESGSGSKLPEVQMDDQLRDE
jgi:hypothetical protein